ncbi:MAG: hypothetical protein U0S36_13215 [Candidatus Nanopelagicales bacterium]
MTEGQQYQDGQVVNGHRYNASANAWEPLPQPPVAAAPTAEPAAGTAVLPPVPTADQTAAPHTTAPTHGSNGLATAGFILGLLGFLGSWVPLLNVIGILLGVLGVVLSAVGLAKAKRVASGKGLAIAGLVLGGLAIIIAVVINAAFANSVNDAVGKATGTEVQAPPGSTGNVDGSGELGTARENPAPLGSIVSGDDWTVKVNSVTTVKADSLDQKPKSGKTLLVINVTATYNGSDPQGETAWATVKYVTADGSTIDSTDAFFVAEEPFDSLKKLYKGASITGDKILEVPADWQGGVLAVKPSLLSDDTFIAVK